MSRRTNDSGWHCYLPVTEREIAQGVFLTSIGWQDAPAGADYPPPGHPEAYAFTWDNGRVVSEWMVVFIDAGEGELETRRMQAPLRPGGVLYIPPGQWHRYRPLPNVGWQVRWFTCSGEMLHRLRKLEVLPDQCTVGTGGSETTAVFKRLAKAVRSEPQANSLVLGGLAIELIGHLQAQPTEKAALQTTHDQSLVKALEFLRSNSHRPITVNDVARAVAVSRRSLERRFQEEQGMSVVVALREFRMNRAKGLLLDTRLAVKEIAYLCGFHDVRSFIRVFRGECGMSPGRWRMV
ncbi:MAG: AraC family transcriptional regulator [Verrucomicrobiota bacterium]